MSRRLTRPRRGSRFLAPVGLLLWGMGALAGCAPAQVQARSASPLPAEERTARYLESVRDQHPRLAAFLRAMPKGGDLHSHLVGAVYAESFVRWAAEDGLCVSLASLSLTPPPCDAAGGRPPASEALRNTTLYGQLIDAMSMRNWHPARLNGHDQFFATFGKFYPAAVGRTGDMLAEVAARAAHGRVSYLELMHTPDGGAVAGLGRQVGWTADLGVMRQRLLQAGLRDTLAAAARSLDEAERRQRQLLGCDRGAAPGCEVVVRYLYQVSRGRAPEQVFAQILAGFEMASRYPKVVGFNLVQPEDNYLPMRDYSLHMEMIDFLHRLYPEVRVTLHAGELAPGLVPPEGLRFHIRQAIRQGHASRIGHGVDVMHEDDPYGLLREMAERGVMVEIALTSNDVILGVSGARHPLRTYLEFGVPVALATDDEGVARSEMTTEFLRAVEEQGVSYPTLKAMVRNSLHYAFVEGASLWSDPRAFVPVAACGAAGGGLASRACRDFVEGSTKARLQWQLERDLAEFEARHAAGVAAAPRP